MVVCLFIRIQGMTIKPLVKLLNVKRADKRKPSMNERIHIRVSKVSGMYLGWCIAGGWMFI